MKADLNLTDFEMVIVKDLGYIFPTEKSTKKARMAIFECTKCKNHITVNVNSAKRNKQKHCKKCSSLNRTHASSNTRLYQIWKGMKTRCNPNNKAKFPYHAGKGIKVCDSWAPSFETFKIWALSNGYSDSLSIDRIDGNKDYSPDNCRWVGGNVQSANSKLLHSTNKSGYRGVSWNKEYQKWEVSIGVNKVTTKVGYYDDPLTAAKAYDTFVLANNLPHTINNVLEKDERVEPNVGKLLPSTNTSGYLGVTSPLRIQELKNPWVASVSKGKTKLWSKYFSNPLTAAIERDIYILENMLDSKRNFPDITLEELLAKRTNEAPY
jgi:hypothetical protein